jgi:AraC family transcriptional regulator of adaptative response / DNA-3-methyladenine glycosylase II
MPAATHRLPYRPPYDHDAILRFLAARAIEGMETVTDGLYRRTIALGSGSGSVRIGHEPEHAALRATIDAPDEAVPAILARIRHVFDLDADLAAVGSHLARDPVLARLIAGRPGLRVPGGWDGFEQGVRAILGQQVTVGHARRLAGVLVRAHGGAVDGRDLSGLVRTFPDPDRIAGADLSVLAIPAPRREAIRAFACAVLAGPGLFDPAAPVEEAVARLRQVRGIGEWTAQYLALRALGHRDAFPASDVALLRAMAIDGERPIPAALQARAEAWRPYRAYAAQHLWTEDVDGERVSGDAR